ncbi:MAG: hypothetical protein JXR70_00375 [Spirochaetales bacterium]|nr:hypothetical protein [Spirochaetales bacterium]
MKKCFLILLALMLMLPTGLFAKEELELGIELTPIGAIGKSSEDTNPQDIDGVQQEPEFFDNWLLSLHSAYSWDFWYASVDAVVMAPWMIRDMTSGMITDPDDPSDEIYFPGIYAPGFLFFFDGGGKIEIGNLVGIGEIGFNWLYIYKGMWKASLGTNLRLGLRYKFTENMSVGLTGTAIFPNFATMFRTIGDSFDTDPLVRQDAADRMKFIPMFAMTLHL